jgi:hypothetical protein
MREPLDGELHDGFADIAQRPTRETRVPVFVWKWRVNARNDAMKPVRTPAPSDHGTVPRALRVPIEALTTRDRLRRASASHTAAPPTSLAPHEIAVPRPSRMSTVFAVLGFLLGFAVALAWVEWMHRASLTAMRDAAMLRDPARP